MKKVPCVEFYGSKFVWSDPAVHPRQSRFTPVEYGWQMSDAKGELILVPLATFSSHRGAIESFKQAVDAMDARGPWEIRDLEGVQGSHAMLTK